MADYAKMLRWDDFPDVMTEAEVARILRVHPKTLRNRRTAETAGQGVGLAPPFVRVGRSVRYQKKAVRDYLDSREGFIRRRDEVAAQGGAMTPYRRE